jgi:hypothetical protein
MGGNNKVCKQWLGLLHRDTHNCTLRITQPNEPRILSAEYSSKITNALQPLATGRRRGLAKANVTIIRLPRSNASRPVNWRPMLQLASRSCSEMGMPNGDACTLAAIKLR